MSKKGSIFIDTSGSGPYSKTLRRPRRNKRKKKAKSKMGKLSQRITALSNRLPKPQRNVVDIISNSTAVSTTAGVNHPMIQIAQGDTSAQRKGDAVVLRSSTLNLAIGKGDSTNALRIILAVTPSTSHLVASDVLQYANLTSNGNLPFASPYKTQPTTAEKTYKILFDKVYNLTDDVDLIVDKVKLDYGKKGKRVSFNAVGSVAPENYNVSLIYFSDSSTSGHPTIGYSFRTKFDCV